MCVSVSIDDPIEHYDGGDGCAVDFNDAFSLGRQTSQKRYRLESLRQRALSHPLPLPYQYRPEGSSLHFLDSYNAWCEGQSTNGRVDSLLTHLKTHTHKPKLVERLRNLQCQY